MAYTTVNKSTDYFNTKLYTGNGGTQSVTGVGFQPDFTWLKSRSNSQDSELYDAVRTATKAMHSNSASDESTYANGLTAFGTDGFTVGDRNNVNGSGNNMVAWNWKANGAGSSNSDGTITSTVSANTTAGFSIVTYTGNATTGATVGHGLGVAPSYVVGKNRSASGNSWAVYSKGMGNTQLVFWDAQDAAASYSQIYNNTVPSNSLITLGNGGNANGNGQNIVLYCFAEKTGFSKFGSYIGNGNNDGTFVYTGFKPAFVIVKATATTDNWTMYDDKRIGYNPKNYFLYPNLNNAEDTSNPQWFDMYSNGFKIRSTSSTTNTSGNKYIYLAFGQSLVGTNNIPCTAR